MEKACVVGENEANMQMGVEMRKGGKEMAS